MEKPSGFHLYRSYFHFVFTIQCLWVFFLFYIIPSEFTAVFVSESTNFLSDKEYKHVIVILCFH